MSNKILYITNFVICRECLMSLGQCNWVDYCGLEVKTRNACRILVGKPCRKQLLKRLRNRYEDNFQDWPIACGRKRKKSIYWQLSLFLPRKNVYTVLLSLIHFIVMKSFALNTRLYNYLSLLLSFLVIYYTVLLTVSWEHYSWRYKDEIICSYIAS